MVPARRTGVVVGRALIDLGTSQVKACGMLLQQVPDAGSAINERRSDDHVRLPGDNRRLVLALYRLAQLPVRPWCDGPDTLGTLGLSKAAQASDKPARQRPVGAGFASVLGARNRKPPALILIREAWGSHPGGSLRRRPPPRGP